MNDNNKTSYSNQENKKVNEIKFEEFPGDLKARNKKNEIIKFKKVIYVTILVIILAFLFVGSSFLNQKILDKNNISYYKLVNKFSGKYALIEPKERSIIYKDIGFDVSKEEQRKLNDQVYNATYAYHKKENTSDVFDTISVYYDHKDVVYYVNANLIYDKTKFNLRDNKKNIINLLNNFMNVKLDDNYILSLEKKGFYYFDKSSPKVSIYLNESKDKIQNF